MKENKLKSTINESFIPFDFANLLTSEKIIEIFKQHSDELTETDINDIKKFLQVWMEVLYLQFKRQQNLEYEQQKESDIVYQGEYRRAG